jgi:hypothetical protein
MDIDFSYMILPFLFFSFFFFFFFFFFFCVEIHCFYVFGVIEGSKVTTDGID